MRLSIIDVLRGKAIREDALKKYVLADAPLWQFWHWHKFMGVWDNTYWRRMSKKEIEEFNRTQPEELKLK